MVSFAWPLLPVFSVVIGVWITVVGLALERKVLFWAVLTIATGALVYHFRLMRSTKAPR